MRTILALGFLLFLSAGTANCQEQTDTGPDVANTENTQALEQQKDELLGLLAQVDERYGDVAASLRSIEDQIKSTTAGLDKIRKEINNYQGQIDKLDRELAGQVKAAYALGQQDKLKLMLNQQDPALSSRMMVYYEYLNKSRLEKLANLQQTVKYLDQLDKDKQTETELLEKNLAKKRSEQAALDEVRRERNGLVAKINSDVYSEQDQLSLLKESENKLISLIQTLENEEDNTNQESKKGDEDSSIPENTESFPKLTGDFSTLKGKLPLPVRGKLASMFDSASSEATWKGILINAKEGAEIKAVMKGKVTYAGTLKGYGLLIIIEHDKQYMSLYAFNQSLYKHKGDNVEAGDVIASVGQSGGRSKPGLYFEIRQNGKPVDPLLWCRN
ncbi:murein hydrolase activator EnvC [Methyloglobulus morosus KoM1]|uniref:Murein hydrolase activator EnvC n=1 Tax=Methyloglobulus morosus KoM1 TaxID=1116472 RepID=V5DQW1_9GAMM|nr:peptidoglycan DD-metalloendopeptidase family protein [Methyloglobulus morosus]ESS69826.1 murein hydrolase activator EnvC [Methyloglobulus morosus KoM1]